MSLIPSSSSLPAGPTRSTRSQRILSEEAYTDALSELIKRDYFPDLERLQAENDYLEALQAIRDEAEGGGEGDGDVDGDDGGLGFTPRDTTKANEDKEARLRLAIQRLVAIETRQAHRNANANADRHAGSSSRTPAPRASARSTRWQGSAAARGETPGLTPLVDRAWDAPTPRYPLRGAATRTGSEVDEEAGVAGSSSRRWEAATPTPRRKDVNILDTPRSTMGDDDDGREEENSDPLDPSIDLTHHTLSSFQSLYTSQDNASFLSLLSRAERERREKYAWAYGAVERENAKRIKGLERDREDSRMGREMGRYWERVEGVERRLIEDGERERERGVIEGGEVGKDLKSAKGEGEGEDSKALVTSNKAKRTSMGPPSNVVSTTTTTNTIKAKAMALVPKPKRRRLSGEEIRDEEAIVALDRPQEDQRQATFPSWRSKVRNGLFFDPSEGVSTTERRSSSLEVHASERRQDAGGGAGGEAKASAFDDETTVKRLRPSTNFGATRLEEREEESHGASGGGGGTPSTPRSSRLDAAIASSEVLSSVGDEGGSVAGDASSSRGGLGGRRGGGMGLGGYDLLSPIPSPRPDMLGEDRVKQLMTWGRVVGTPRALGNRSSRAAERSGEGEWQQDGGSTPAFQQPPTSRREELAHRLAERSSRPFGGLGTPRGNSALAGLGGKGSRSSTPFGTPVHLSRGRGGDGTPLDTSSSRARMRERQVSLSPAGRNLLQRVGAVPRRGASGGGGGAGVGGSGGNSRGLGGITPGRK